MNPMFPQFHITREFQPHRLFRGGHAQTLAGNCLPGSIFPSSPKLHLVEFGDGDKVALHDDCPPGWSDTDLSAFLVHGLAGTSRSPYMQRVAGKLLARGVRVFRMDLRACGAGSGLARLPYHPGRSQDGLWALQFAAGLCPFSPMAFVGFSLGANLGLKMLGEFRDKLPKTLRRAIAINPPIELEQSASALERFFTQIYNTRFVRCLLKQIAKSPKLIRRKAVLRYGKRLKKIRDFDDYYTRAVWGYASVSDYYAEGSAARWLQKVNVPTLILAAEDDPIVPPSVFKDTPVSPCVRVHLSQSGGHLGFISRGGIEADRRWMEWRIVDWVVAEEPQATIHKAA
jgi:predicted alpha/beta-fold hydrolase